LQIVGAAVGAAVGLTELWQCLADIL